MIRTFIRVWSAAAVVLSPLFSCSIFHQKHANSSHDLTVRDQQQARTDSFSHVTIYSRLHLQNEQHREWTEIFPLGDFTYSPDSGFSGRARLVRINRKRSGVSLTSDSSLTRIDSSHRDQFSQTMLRSKEEKQTESTFKWSPVSLYWYLAAFVLLLLLTGIVGSKRR